MSFQTNSCNLTKIIYNLLQYRLILYKILFDGFAHQFASICTNRCIIYFLFRLTAKLRLYRTAINCKNQSLLTIFIDNFILCRRIHFLSFFYNITTNSRLTTIYMLTILDGMHIVTVGINYFCICSFIIRECHFKFHLILNFITQLRYRQNNRRNFQRRCHIFNICT